MSALNTLIDKLNNKVLIAIIVALFLIGVFRSFTRR